MMKPYFVELKISTVVMAENPLQAHLIAEEYGYEISDVEHHADSAELIESIEHLVKLDPEWSGDRVPYGGDLNTPLKQLLPATKQVKDTRTIDMFETANIGDVTCLNY